MIKWLRYLFCRRRESQKQKINEYKIKVFDYLIKFEEIELNAHEVFDSYGDDCQGSLDWTPLQLKRKKERENELRKLEGDLALSPEKIKQIWCIAKENIAQKKF